MENSNPRSELEKIKNKVLEYLQHLPPVPSVPMTVMPATTKVGAETRATFCSAGGVGFGRHSRACTDRARCSSCGS